MVAGEYLLDVQGINLQGSEKNVKKKNRASFPQEKGGAKKSEFYHNTRDQGSELRDQPSIIPTRSDRN